MSIFSLPRMPFPPMDQYGQESAFSRPLIQHTQIVIDDNGGVEPFAADSQCHGLNMIDHASVHTHNEDHTQADAADEDPEDMLEEDHPDEMLDEPSADRDNDPVGYGEEDHGDHADMLGEEFTPKAS